MEAEKKGRLVKSVKDGRDAEDIYNRFIEPWAEKTAKVALKRLEAAECAEALFQCQGFYNACQSLKAEFQHLIMEGKRAQKRLEEDIHGNKI